MITERFNALMFCMLQRAIQEEKCNEFIKMCAELKVSNRKCTTKTNSRSKIKNNNAEE